VRIGPREPKLVLQYLDAGMMGVMMPGLENADDVRMLVAAVKYPPEGRRGAGLSRASAYAAYSGDAAGYLAFANRETLVIPQFEDPGLLPRLPAMLGVAGVDALMVGPRDLSLVMGFADGPAHPEVQAVIEAVVAACARAGVAAGITAATREQAAREVARGMRVILAGLQPLLLAGGRAFLPESPTRTRTPP
jgi:4-hydroxy-2-oxoheptanedioate aldolase